MKRPEITLKAALGLGKGRDPNAHLRSHQGVCGDQRRLPFVSDAEHGAAARTGSIHCSGRRLCARCRRGRPRPDRAASGWTLDGRDCDVPGGKIEAGERPEDTLIRELKELGIIVSEPCLAPRLHIRKPHLSGLSPVDAAVRLPALGTPTALEGQALKWVRPNQLKEFPMPPATCR